jgi:hypothetical protein
MIPKDARYWAGRYWSSRLEKGTRFAVADPRHSLVCRRKDLKV